VGVAAKLGRAHVVFWLAAMLTFHMPPAGAVRPAGRAAVAGVLIYRLGQARNTLE
jgi:hypothetical protein